MEHLTGTDAYRLWRGTQVNDLLQELPRFLEITIQNRQVRASQ